jgi:hypothetical protein
MSCLNCWDYTVLKYGWYTGTCFEPLKTMVGIRDHHVIFYWIDIYQCTNPTSSNNTFYRMYSRHRVNFTKSMQMYEFVHFNQAIAAVQLTEVIWTGNIVFWAWVWAFLVTQPSFKAAAVSSVMFSWKEFHLIPRLKMNGVLPPLPNVFMASHIISGTPPPPIQLLLLLFTAYICLYCVTAFMKSVIFKNLSLFQSLYVGTSAHTQVSIDMCA